MTLFQKTIRRLSYLESHYWLLVTGGMALVAFVALAGRVSYANQIIVTWDVYALSLLFFAWMRILTAKPTVAIRLATLAHSSRTMVFGFVLCSCCASLGAVAYLFANVQHLSKEPMAKHVVAAVGTVVISWVLVHTIFSLHYAYLFHRRQADEATDKALLFPGDKAPDYLDFAYFSFVIGMTSQVSDVQISSREIRRWALLHGLISFGFNAVILAVSINVVAGLF